MLGNLVAEMVARRHAEPDDLRLATRFASQSSASADERKVIDAEPGPTMSHVP
jgi:hypothetical protein